LSESLVLEQALASLDSTTKIKMAVSSPFPYDSFEFICIVSAISIVVVGCFGFIGYSLHKRYVGPKDPSRENRKPKTKQEKAKKNRAALDRFKNRLGSTVTRNSAHSVKRRKSEDREDELEMIEIGFGAYGGYLSSKSSDDENHHSNYGIKDMRNKGKPNDIAGSRDENPMRKSKDSRSASRDNFKSKSSDTSDQDDRGIRNMMTKSIDFEAEDQVGRMSPKNMHSNMKSFSNYSKDLDDNEYRRNENFNMKSASSNYSTIEQDDNPMMRGNDSIERSNSNKYTEHLARKSNPLQRLNQPGPGAKIRQIQEEQSIISRSRSRSRDKADPKTSPPKTDEQH
jgi:hypothetical protein